MTTRPNANMIREHCDGELSPQQAADYQRFLQEHPEARESIDAQVNAERALRERVGAVMGAAQAPAALRDRIHTAIMQSLSDDVLARIDGGADEGKPAGRRRFASVGGDRINLFAVAATLALIAGAVLFGIFGRTIDQIPAPVQTDLVSELAAFAGNEHDQCAASSECMQQRAKYSAHDQAEALLTDWLDAPVRVANLDSIGYDFIGAGVCEMPVEAHSGHIVYRKRAPVGARSPMVSVFVFPNKGPCGGKMCEGMSCGEWKVAAEPGSRCKHRVMRSTDGRLVYLLVCCNGRDLDSVAQTIASAVHSSHSGPESH